MLNVPVNNFWEFETIGKRLGSQNVFAALYFSKTTNTTYHLTSYFVYNLNTYVFQLSALNSPKNVSFHQIEDTLATEPFFYRMYFTTSNNSTKYLSSVSLSSCHKMTKQNFQFFGHDAPQGLMGFFALQKSSSMSLRMLKRTVQCSSVQTRDESEEYLNILHHANVSV